MNISFVEIVRWDNILFDRVISFGESDSRELRRKSVRLAYSAKRRWKFSLLEAQRRNSIGDPDVTPTMTPDIFAALQPRRLENVLHLCLDFRKLSALSAHPIQTLSSWSLSHRQFNNSPLSRVIASNLSASTVPLPYPLPDVSLPSPGKFRSFDRHYQRVVPKGRVPNAT